ncbi:MAG TPA: hypothetical protein PLP30_00605 [Clostridia bacterium]|nr:hypothetical protein [Clostridia bacterium]
MKQRIGIILIIVLLLSFTVVGSVFALDVDYGVYGGYNPTWCRGWGTVDCDDEYIYVAVDLFGPYGEHLGQGYSEGYEVATAITNKVYGVDLNYCYADIVYFFA